MTSPPSQPSTLWIQHHLYTEYSSSQSYFYASKITEIIKSKRTPATLLYDDLESLWEDEEFLKRTYQGEEFPRKMAAFKEYYYYHEDCPRIFLKGVEHTYERWHEKRRDIIYKKLKQMFNQTFSSSGSEEDDGRDKDLPPVSHFLLDISDYNPFSKKYYLRVQAKHERDKAEQERKKKLQKTKSHLKDLNNDLSKMIFNLNDISRFTIQDTSLHINISRIDNQTQRNEPKTNPKLNFRKKKTSILSHSRSKQSQDLSRRDSLDKNSNSNGKLGHSKQLSELPKQPRVITQLKVSSKEILLGESKNQSEQKVKPKPIISLSSFSKNPSLPRQREEVKVPKLTLKPSNRDSQLKNTISTSNRKVISINSQKKLKSKSTTLELRQVSLKKLGPSHYLHYNEMDQFTDRKLAEPKGLMSYKSEQTTGFGLSQKVQHQRPIKIKLSSKY